MLSEWDREKLRQALGPETGDKVAELLGSSSESDNTELVKRLDALEADNTELVKRLDALEADNASLKAANEVLATEVEELKARPVASPTPPANDPTDGE